LKIINVEQNTPEWKAARLGIPTASSFDKIITAGGKMSSSRHDYMCKLIYERIFQRPCGDFQGTEWTERGHRLEPDAANMYRALADAEPFPIGFITTDNGRIGCSPDRVIWDNQRLNILRGVEIKCPMPWRHLQYTVLGLPREYFVQIQGQMLVAELDAVDFFSFCPGMPCLVHRVDRSASFIKEMSNLLDRFCDELDETEAEARSLGEYRWYEESGCNPLDAGVDGESHRTMGGELSF
jgi:hypothetical protein